ncbi:host cell factor C1 regulator 1 isoform X2 [Pogona vitticeps]
MPLGPSACSTREESKDYCEECCKGTLFGRAMDSTAGLPSSPVLPTHQSLHYSVLSKNMGWSRSRGSDWQQDRAQQVSWSKSSPGVRRCRSAPFAFKRHLENRDQEPSSKHFLSEDKMAARFNSLSLDNDHVYSSNGFPIHDEDPMWQQAYTQLKELQQRLSQDGESEETSSTDEYESSNVIVDGEFLMADCPMLTHPSLLQEGFGRISIIPEEIFLSLNPCTEVVLWSPHESSSLRTIRTLMSLPSSVSSSPQPQQDVSVKQEEMEA